MDICTVTEFMNQINPDIYLSAKNVLAMMIGNDSLNIAGWNIVVEI